MKELTLTMVLPLSLTISLEKELTQTEVAELVWAAISNGIEKNKFGKPLITEVSNSEFDYLLD